jgi:hypothetical protein
MSWLVYSLIKSGGPILVFFIKSGCCPKNRLATKNPIHGKNLAQLKDRLPKAKKVKSGKPKIEKY